MQPFYLPLALFVPPSHAVIHKELNLLYQFWIHTELVTSLGPLDYILNTASHHKVSPHKYGILMTRQSIIRFTMAQIDTVWIRIMEQC